MNAEIFKEAVVDCKKVCDNINVPIKSEYDENKLPVFDDDKIRFNGVEDDGHETFYIERNFQRSDERTDDTGKFFDFCKTASKPYDVNVCCCLIIFKHYFKDDFDVRSDGDNDDWRDASNECKEILGYGKDFSVEEE